MANTHNQIYRYDLHNLVLHTSSTAQWHALIHEAQVHTGYSLNEELESYLVFLLMRFTGCAQLVQSVLALDYLNSQVACGNKRLEQLKEVGDKCLLFAGLFPGRAQRRLVTLRYFIDIGSSAYHNRSEYDMTSARHLFSHLAHQFTKLTDILQATRELSGQPSALSLLDDIAYWQSTGSEYAKRRIEQQLPGDVRGHLLSSSQQSKPH